MSKEHIEFLITAMAWFMLAVAAFGVIYPWMPHWPLARILVHLPLLLIPLWIAYEMIMPEYMNIRVDLFILTPIFILTVIVYLAKIAIFRRIKHQAEQGGAGNPAKPGA